MKRVLCLFAVVMLVACMTVPAFGVDFVEGWEVTGYQFGVEGFLTFSYFDKNMSIVNIEDSVTVGVYVTATQDADIPIELVQPGDYIIWGSLDGITASPEDEPFQVIVFDSVGNISYYDFGQIITIPEGSYLIMVQSVVTPVILEQSGDEPGGSPSYDFNLVDNFRALLADVLFGDDPVSVIAQQYINIIAWCAVIVLLSLPFLLLLFIIKFVGRWR